MSAGNSLVPPTILGRFAILCAILRQFHLIFQISLFTSELRTLDPAIFFVDQLSAGGATPQNHLSKATSPYFYCHFPDKLLAQKGNILKSLYRIPFDSIESWSTGCSDGIVVNSNFTRGVFGDAFPLLQHRDPKVVYPCVDIESTSETIELDNSEGLWKDLRVLLSINRFERKKDIGLAIRAYAKLSEKERQGTRLVLAGKTAHTCHSVFHADLDHQEVMTRASLRMWHITRNFATLPMGWASSMQHQKP